MHALLTGSGVASPFGPGSWLTLKPSLARVFTLRASIPDA
jgi:hypothetical protein